MRRLMNNSVGGMIGLFRRACGIPIGRAKVTENEKRAVGNDMGGKETHLNALSVDAVVLNELNPNRPQGQPVLEVLHNRLKVMLYAVQQMHIFMLVIALLDGA